MVNISESVKSLDKIIIYKNAAKKLLRGFFTLGVHKSGKIFVGKSVHISHRASIFCGKNVKFEDYSEIHGLSTNGLHFGDNVTIGRYTEIRPSSYYGVGNIGYGLEMGEHSSIGPFGFVGCSGPIKIGKDVMVGPRVSFFAENHNFTNRDVDIKYQGVNNKGITIEDNCWIGSGVIILDGVTIGKGSVIGAGTLVAKDVPQNSIVYNKKSRVIRER
ncbi:acyltransferase [Lactobacillus corticis]|uniref:Acetyltransferase n=1 Tax=Lactobacillus corticis TaxID=2201249 RepID=A0A916VIQ8_9LACO|nr:acyltransferase [Lactobacillus corticis]GFZ26174.1 acetyltransferase [Lactobacillus corticis]